MKIRRLVVEHRCTRMVTLTLAPEWATGDRAVMVRYIRAFQRALRAQWPELKYVMVLEPHPGGHGWHAHMLVDRWVDKATMARVWRRGFVDVRKVRARTDRGAREAARCAARYAAKYVAKDAATGQLGAHRYFRPQDMSVTEVAAEADTTELEYVIALFTAGAPVLWRWSSEDTEEWRGPPARCWRW